MGMISEAVFYVMLFVMGAMSGSFLCCQARRLRVRELRQKSLGKWSVCMNCKKRLKWYENVPIVSWLALRGRCAKCGGKIGVAEFLAEVLTAAVFVLVGLKFDPASAGVLEWARLVFRLMFASILMFLAIYDGLYGELPSTVLTFLVMCAIMIVILEQWSLVSVGLALLAGVIFGGLYLVLYLVSHGKWVGDGDWVMAGAIGLALMRPFAALVAIAIANAAACVVMAPIVAKKKDHKIYFGPFLMVGYVVAIVLLKYGIINL